MKWIFPVAVIRRIGLNGSRLIYVWQLHAPVSGLEWFFFRLVGMFFVGSVAWWQAHAIVRHRTQNPAPPVAHIHCAIWAHSNFHYCIWLIAGKWSFFFMFAHCREKKTCEWWWLEIDYSAFFHASLRDKHEQTTVPWQNPCGMYLASSLT